MSSDPTIPPWSKEAWKHETIIERLVNIYIYITFNFQQGAWEALKWGSLFTTFGVFSLLLEKIGFPLTSKFVIFGYMTVVVIFFIVGIIIYKLGIVKKFMSSQNSYNSELLEIKKNVLEIKAMLQDNKKN